MRSLSRSALWALLLLALVTCPFKVRATHEEKSEHISEEPVGNGPEEYESFEEDDYEFENNGKEPAYSRPSSYGGPPPPPPPPPPSSYGQVGYSSPGGSYALPPPPRYSEPAYQHPEPAYYPPPPPPQPYQHPAGNYSQQSAYQQPAYQQAQGPAYAAPAPAYNMSQPAYQYPAPAEYAAPAPAYNNMSQQAYQAPAAPAQAYPAEYSAPSPAPAYNNMSQPDYQPVNQAPAYQAPAPAYHAEYPAPTSAYNNVSQLAYQAPAQPAPSYQAPSPPPAYNNMSQPAYQAPAQPAPSYQAPPQPPAYNNMSQPAYQAPAQQAQQQPQYSAQHQTYNPVPLPYMQPNYSMPSPMPIQDQYLEPIAYVPPYSPAAYIPPIEVVHTNYSAPQPQYQPPMPAPPKYAPPPTMPPKYTPPMHPVSAPHYTPPQMPAPRPHPPMQTSNYTAPKPMPMPMQSTYKPAVPMQPVYKPQQPMQQTNYTGAQAAYNKPPQTTAMVSKYPAELNKMTNYLNQAVKSYFANELVSMVGPAGYRSNHWSLQYYATTPYRACPTKGAYLAAPSYKDIEAAFIYAQMRLASSRASTMQYMNSTQASWAGRHQIFSLMSQTSAQMDEEGLLLELVSQYLADRACLTKWDKQRYLPALTKFISSSNFPGTHSCSAYYRNEWQAKSGYCAKSKYRTFDGFCNNPYHPYWGKSNVCHIRLLSPDYADGISEPRNAYSLYNPLPNPRSVSNYIHNDVPLEGPYNLMKMQWGQFINHDISNTALSSYEGLVDCCKQPNARGCWPIHVPAGDKFYTPLNVTCLNFIRSGVCPLCQLGPRQQLNKNTAFLDLSLVYGNSLEQANKLRTFQYGLLRTSLSKNGEMLLPIATTHEQCSGQCFQAGDSRVNQHPALTVIHTLLLRNHNRLAEKLRRNHPNWNDEYLFQEARRINVAEYQMITYNEYFPIVFGPILSAYYKLIPQKTGYTYYDPKVDPTTWNEYTTATCRFGHSQIQSTFGLYSKIYAYGQQSKEPTFRLKDWFMRPSLLSDGLVQPIVNGLLARPSQAVDPWITNDVRNHLYQSHREYSGGDLAATNIWRGRDHGLPGYTQYVEYCFNYKIRNWKDLSLFIPYYTLNNLRKLYRTVENIDLFTGGMSERHFPDADIGPTFACVNGIQYYHLKFGDRFYFEHGGQAGSFTPPQLQEIRKSTLAKLVCQTSYIQAVPQYAFLPPSQYNPLVNCSQFADTNTGLF